MTRKLALISLCLVAISWGVGVRAQEERPSSAPWLGPQLHDVQLAGTLGEVARHLGELTGQAIVLVPGPGGGWGAAEAGDLAARPVQVELAGATLDEILLAICAQAGAVYEVQLAPAPGKGGPAVPTVMLRPGDPDLDPRPVAIAGNYLVRVTGIQTMLQRSAAFRWGQPIQNWPGNQATSLTLEITARTIEAARQLAGLGVQTRAIPDQGAAMEATGQYPPGYYLPLPIGESLIRTGGLSLPLPPAEATRLNRVEGSLVLFSQVKADELELAPKGVGQEARAGETSAVMKSWGPDPNDPKALLVEIAAKCPTLPKGEKERRAVFAADWGKAVLVTKEGKEYQGQVYASKRQEEGEGDWQMTFRFFSSAAAGRMYREAIPLANVGGIATVALAAPVEVADKPAGAERDPRAGTLKPAPGSGGAVGAGGPAPTDTPELDWQTLSFAALKLTLVRVGTADRHEPFVIENVPLP